MSQYFVFFLVVICFTTFLQLVNGYRILCIFPAPSISHQVVFRGLSLALNKQGHELVVVTPDPINDPNLTNYTEISTRFEYDTYSNIQYINTRKKLKWLDWIEETSIRMCNLTDRILDHPDVRKLYAKDSNEKFDLLIVELLYWQPMYPLAMRFNVPTIGIASLGLGLLNNFNIGNPILPSHPSNWELETELFEPLSIWQRLKNFVFVWKYIYWFQTTYAARQNAIAKKYFGNDIPDVFDLEKNISLIFVNQQGPISYARPNVPNLIEIGGFHVSKDTIPLPNDLQKILDSATEGFVYMSLGSNAKSNMLPERTINEFLTAFSKLPYQVLWKFENDSLPGKPENVHLMKWVPQQAVLAHPNLKVFIYQGGLQSTEEAVHHAVPLIGFPVLFDQDMQVHKMASLGVAIKLEISAVDGNEFFKAITTVATDNRYKQRMLKLRSILNDKPHDPLETAVWWAEYVIRHKGATHLHSMTADQPWYSRQDMDIIALISTGLIILFSLIFVILYKLFKFTYLTISADSLSIKKNN